MLNVEELRNKGFCFRRYADIYLEIGEKLVFRDQDLLNYIHWKNVKYVDNMKYGLFAHSAHEMGLNYEDVKNTVSILHYAGAAKPWTVNLIRYDVEIIWWEYLKKTPFYFEIMKQVFYDMLESTFTENKLIELNKENARLKELLFRYQEILKKLGY